MWSPWLICMRSNRSLSSRIAPSSSGGTVRPLSISDAIRVLQPAERLVAAVLGGALELRAKAAHLGGKLLQRAVGGDIRNHAAQRDHRLLELLERHRVALGRLAGRGELVDLLVEAAHRVLEPGEALGRLSPRSAWRTSASSRSSAPSAAPSAPAARVRSTRSASARTSPSSASMARRGIASVRRRPISARSLRSALKAFS